MIRWTCIAVAAALLMLTTAGARPQQAESARPAGEGVICAWAIYSAVAEVSQRCPVNAKPAFQEELQRTVETLDSYMLANSAITPEQVARFKSEQSMAGAPEAELCQDETVGLYEALSNVDPNELRTQITALTTRPGEPTWGTCL